MKVKIGKHAVDVVDRACPKRPCYGLGFDKGSFAFGRGYTSYHKDKKGNLIEHPVCRTRHLYGCPGNSVCEKCRTLSVNEPGSGCTWPGCGGTLVARKETAPGETP